MWGFIPGRKKPSPCDQAAASWQSIDSPAALTLAYFNKSSSKSSININWAHGHVKDDEWVDWLGDYKSLLLAAESLGSSRRKFWLMTVVESSDQECFNHQFDKNWIWPQTHIHTIARMNRSVNNSEVTVKEPWGSFPFFLLQQYRLEPEALISEFAKPNQKTIKKKKSAPTVVGWLLRHRRSCWRKASGSSQFLLCPQNSWSVFKCGPVVSLVSGLGSWNKWISQS